MQKELQDLPDYKCKKIVKAALITSLSYITNELIIFNEITEEKLYVKLNAEYFNKHQPTVGGYLVIYNDGYMSFSPPEAFNNGYEIINIEPEDTHL